MRKLGLPFLVVFFYSLLIPLSAPAQKLNCYKKGERHGLWVVYHDAQRKIPESKGRYRKGKQKGRWYYFYSDGKLERKEIYRFKKIRTTHYYPSGQVRKEGKARLDELQLRMHYYYYGEWKHYRETGELEKVEFYVKGEKKNEHWMLPLSNKGQNDSLIKVLFALNLDFKRSQDTLIAVYNAQGAKSPGYMAAKQWAKQNDSLVFERVAGIMARFAYPSKETVGDQYSVLFYIISSGSQALKEKYYSLILDARDKGILNAKDVAYFIDKVMVGKGEKQVYGTQFKLNTSTNTVLYYPIRDFAEVNANRKAVGLEEVDWNRERFTNPNNN